MSRYVGVVPPLRSLRNRRIALYNQDAPIERRLRAVLPTPSETTRRAVAAARKLMSRPVAVPHPAVPQGGSRIVRAVIPRNRGGQYPREEKEREVKEPERPPPLPPKKPKRLRNREEVKDNIPEGPPINAPASHLIQYIESLINSGLYYGRRDIIDIIEQYLEQVSRTRSKYLVDMSYTTRAYRNSDGAIIHLPKDEYKVVEKKYMLNVPGVYRILKMLRDQGYEDYVSKGDDVFYSDNFDDFAGFDPNTMTVNISEIRRPDKPLQKSGGAWPFINRSILDLRFAQMSPSDDKVQPYLDRLMKGKFEFEEEDEKIEDLDDFDEIKDSKSEDKLDQTVFEGYIDNLNKMNSECCFIHALRQADVCEDHIKKFKMSTDGKADFAINNIKEIAEMLGRQIKLSKLDEVIDRETGKRIGFRETRSVPYGTKTELPAIDMALAFNHFFYNPKMFSRHFMNYYCDPERKHIIMDRMGSHPTPELFPTQYFEDNHGKWSLREDCSKIRVHTAVWKLLEAGYMDDFHPVVKMHVFLRDKKFVEDHDTLNFCANEQKEFEFIRRKTNPYVVFTADTETDTIGDPVQQEELEVLMRCFFDDMEEFNSKNPQHKVNSAEQIAELKKLFKLKVKDRTSHRAVLYGAYLTDVHYQRFGISSKFVPSKPFIERVRPEMEELAFTNWINYIADQTKHAEDHLIHNNAKYAETAKEKDKFGHWKRKRNCGVEAKVYFHNAKYDVTVLAKFLKISGIVALDTTLYSVTCYHNGVMITFIDSMKMVNTSLAKFGKTFNLPKRYRKKEMVSYAFHTFRNINRTRMPIKEYRSLLKPSQWKDFDAQMVRSITNEHYREEGVKNEFEINEEDWTFDPWKFYEFYLRYDLLVLAEGLKSFARQINDMTRQLTAKFALRDFENCPDPAQAFRERYDQEPTCRPFIIEESYDERKSSLWWDDKLGNLGEPEIDMFRFLTIASLAFYIVGYFGAYDGTYAVSGCLKKFIAKTANGGRVMANSKYQGKLINAECFPDQPRRDIMFLDARSLYPTAEYRLSKGYWFDDPPQNLRRGRSKSAYRYGFPLGKAKRIDGDVHVQFLKNRRSWDYYSVEVIIRQVPRHLDMPLICHRKDGESLEYLNEPLLTPTCMDRFTLEDYMKFHKITWDDVQILRGAYWDRGCNPRIGEIIELIYANRLVAQYEKNDVMSEVLKLIMNASYGKNLLKPRDYQVKIIRNDKWDKKNRVWLKDEGYNQFVYNYYHLIHSVQKINEFSWLFKIDQVDTSYNFCHLGSQILSMSKRIMNEVFNIAEDHKIPIFYTDTDSIAMFKDDIPKLSEEYNKKYGLVLCGKQMGQFHEDLDLELGDDKFRAVMTEFFAYGKKIYCGPLYYNDIETGLELRGYKMRMKGINKSGLEFMIAERFDGDPMALYVTLREYTLEFDLCKGKAMFDNVLLDHVRTLKRKIRSVGKGPIKEWPVEG